MAISTKQISDQLDAYLAAHPDETVRVAALVDAVRRGGELTARDVLPGHVTTGAFLLDGDGRVIQIGHRSLGRWLNPGGHCEVGDVSLVDAALRELTEETGIALGEISLLTSDPARRDAPFDVDVHFIPANEKKGEPGHLHYDFRYAFRLSGSGAVVLQEDEVDGHRWVTIAELGESGFDSDKVVAVKLATIAGR